MISVSDIASELSPAEHLLVITPPGGSGCYGFRLPFRDATLVEAKPAGLPEDEPVGLSADGVVIECPAGDVSWADRILAELDTRISGTSTVVLAFVSEYPRIDDAGRSPGLPALHGFHATSMGLLGDAVSLVLARKADGGADGEADAAAVATSVSGAVELGALAARGSRPRSPADGSAAKGIAATISVLRGEIRQLSAALTKAQQELAVTSREYRALRYSRLGKLTVRYWQFRRNLAARGSAKR